MATKVAALALPFFTLVLEMCFVGPRHRGQPIDCPERNSSIATKIYLDISTRFLKYLFAKSVLSHNSDTYLHVTRCHQLLEGVSLVNHQSRNIDSRFRNDFGGRVH